MTASGINAPAREMIAEPTPEDARMALDFTHYQLMQAAAAFTEDGSEENAALLTEAAGEHSNSFMQAVIVTAKDTPSLVQLMGYSYSLANAQAERQAADFNSISKGVTELQAEIPTDIQELMTNCMDSTGEFVDSLMATTHPVANDYSKEILTTLISDNFGLQLKLYLANLMASEKHKDGYTEEGEASSIDLGVEWHRLANATIRTGAEFAGRMALAVVIMPPTALGVGYGAISNHLRKR